MRDDEFEWDDAKAARNERKHGVTFEEAREVFRGEPYVEDYQDEHGEERWRRIAPSSSRLLVVVYTLRGARYHVISAREAERHEQDRYRREASPHG